MAGKFGTYDQLRPGIDSIVVTGTNTNTFTLLASATYLVRAVTSLLVVGPSERTPSPAHVVGRSALRAREAARQHGTVAR